MGYRIEYVKEKEIVVVQFRGDVTIEDQLEAIEEMLAADYFSSNMNVVEDLRYGKLKYNIEDQDVVIERIQELVPQLDWIRCAILVAGPVQTAYAKLFEILTREVMSIEFKVFSTEPAAKNWLIKKHISVGKRTKQVVTR